jgi:hypothetical protein
LALSGTSKEIQQKPNNKEGPYEGGKKPPISSNTQHR